MNDLYISDLDGTLLQPTVELSNETIEILNNLIEQGLQFSIATARTAASVAKILEPLNLTMPIILMNGVAIYDINKKEYLKVHPVPLNNYDKIITTLKDNNLSPFVYEIKEKQLSTYYTSIANDAMREFYEERVNKYNKKFTQIESLDNLPTSNIIYFAILNTKEALLPAYEIVKELEGISVAFYRDIYFEDDIYFLEIFSDKATKYNGIQYLKSMYQFDTVTSFGDNMNDLPMFLASDISCAVSNAKEQVKEKATHIIESNEDNGVAHFIKNNFKK